MSKNFVLHRDGNPGIMLSDGIGIEFMRQMILDFNEDFSDINKLVQISYSDSAFMFKEEMDMLDKKNLRFSSFYESKRDLFYEKLNGELKKIMFQTGLTPNIYIAGREEFKKEISEALNQAGFNQNNIIIEGGAPVLNCDGGCNTCASGC